MVVPKIVAALLPIHRLISQQSEIWNIVMASEMTSLLRFESARTIGDASLPRFIHFYGGRNRFRVSLKRDNHKCLSTLTLPRFPLTWLPSLPSTGSNERQPTMEHIFRPFFFFFPFLRSSVGTNFTIGTSVCGADKHLLINVERQAIPLNVKNSDSNVPSCLALHLSVSLSSYDTARELLSWLRRFSARGSIIIFFRGACTHATSKLNSIFAKFDRRETQWNFPFAAETKRARRATKFFMMY